MHKKETLSYRSSKRERKTEKKWRERRRRKQMNKKSFSKQKQRKRERKKIFPEVQVLCFETDAGHTYTTSAKQ